MKPPKGKVKDTGDLKEAIQGACLISVVAGVAVGFVVSMFATTIWGLGCGIAVIVGVFATLVATIRTTDGPAAEGEVDEQGFRHGRWRWKYDNGEFEREEHYDHGVRHGPQLTWYDNGGKAEEKHFKNGKLCGATTTWFKNGSVWKQSVFENGRLNGPHVEWYVSGQKKLECHYLGEDQFDGDWIAWHEDGQKKIAAHFDHATPVGTWTEWNASGQQICETNFVAGVQQANSTTYFANPPQLKRRSTNPLLFISMLSLVAYAFYHDIQPISFFVPLLLVIFIHELGHFTIAKLVGIPLKTFAIGTGPKVFSYHFRSTAYELRLFPLMGYVREYGLRSSEFRYFKNATRSPVPAEGSTQIQYSEPRQTGSAFVSRPRRLFYYLGGVGFNFLTAFVVLFVGWFHTHLGSADVILGFSDSLQNLGSFMLHPFDSATSIPFKAAGIFWQIVAIISLITAVFNLIPLGFLDGFHVLKTLLELVLRRDVPARWLIPLKVTGSILLFVLLFVEVLLQGAVVVIGVSQFVESLHTPDIVGRVKSSRFLDDSAPVLFASVRRDVAAADNHRLFLVTLQCEGSQVLMTDEYYLFCFTENHVQLVDANKKIYHRPIGVCFGKRHAKSVFNDRRLISRVKIETVQPSSMRGSVKSAAGQITGMTLFDPEITLLYEVKQDSRVFELRYESEVIPFTACKSP
jgi:antitoxin component YwqK of YwqJK toxin-antitoxin module/Zn-dependent protease